MAKAFEVNPQGIEDLLKSDEVANMLQPVANKILSRAIALCPVDTGRLRASLVAERSKAHDGRQDIKVVANTDYAQYVVAKNTFLLRAMN